MKWINVISLFLDKPIFYLALHAHTDLPFSLNFKLSEVGSYIVHTLWAQHVIPTTMMIWQREKTRKIPNILQKWKRIYLLGQYVYYSLCFRYDSIIPVLKIVLMMIVIIQLFRNKYFKSQFNWFKWSTLFFFFSHRIKKNSL